MEPIAQDGRAIAQLEHFFEAVAHEEDGHSAVASLADDGEESLDLVGGERGRRLVENEHARIDRERLRDFDQLLVGHRETANDRR